MYSDNEDKKMNETTEQEIKKLINELFENGKTPMENFGITWSQIKRLEENLSKRII